MVDDPRSGFLVAWGNAVLSGRVAPDVAVAEITHGDEPHRVTGLPGESGEVGLTLALGRLRALGAVGLRLALPVPGDPLGLQGPREFNDAALDAGEAVLADGTGLGLVPVVTGYGPDGDRAERVVWHVFEVVDRPYSGPFLAEADRGLTEAMRDAVETLARLDVAGTGAGAQAAARALRERADATRDALAPGYPQRAVRVLEQARRVRTILALADGDHGAAVTASEMAGRAGALTPLERAGRRALVAAYGACLEPQRAD